MMPWRSPLLRSLLAAFALLGPWGSTVYAASEWQVIKVGNWDYLTVDNIAKFYGFAGEVQPIGNTVQIDNGRNQLEVTLGSREAIVNGVRNWLCFPVIRHADGRFMVSRIDLAKTIEPQFRPQMIRNLGRIKTVVLDPGHGGIEKGAASSYGTEKEFALDTALKLRSLLQAKGFNVLMTRERDEVVPLHERARIANATRDSLFVSLHFNATDANPSATGFEIFSLTPRGAPSTQDNSMLEHFLNIQAGSPVDAASLLLSTSVYHAMLGHMPEFDRGVKRARFAVLRLTNIPAILIEGGFLTEREESRLIARPEWRNKLAQAISVGIENYRGLLERRQRPMLLAEYRRQFNGVLVARDAVVSPPDPARTGAIIPASNPKTLAPSAQITAPVRREPSPQMDVSAALMEAASPLSSSPPEEILAATRVEATADAAPASDEQMAPVVGDSNVSMPAGDEPISEQDQAPPAAQAASAVQVRKYWVLKFAPPPKFRE